MCGLVTEDLTISAEIGLPAAMRPRGKTPAAKAESETMNSVEANRPFFSVRPFDKIMGNVRCNIDANV